MKRNPDALDMLDAWWAVPEAKRAEAIARLSAMIEADQAQPDAAEMEPEAKST